LDEIGNINGLRPIKLGNDASQKIPGKSTALVCFYVSAFASPRAPTPRCATPVENQSHTR
jgi:hypothetical protein